MNTESEEFLEYVGSCLSPLLEKAAAAKSSESLISLIHAEKCPFEVNSATVNIFANSIYKVHVQNGIHFNQFYQPVVLPDNGAGLYIVGGTINHKQNIGKKCISVSNKIILCNNRTQKVTITTFLCLCNENLHDEVGFDKVNILSQYVPLEKQF